MKLGNVRDTFTSSAIQITSVAITSICSITLGKDAKLMIYMVRAWQPPPEELMEIKERERPGRSNCGMRPLLTQPGAVANVGDARGL
jgi:hypothetical protein